MKKLNYSIIAISALIFAGCGGGDIGAANLNSEDTNSANSNKKVVGQLIDNIVAGVDYTCEGNTSFGTTDENGTFKCDKLPVRFHLGNLDLGEIKKIPQDGIVTAQDLVGVDRNDTNDTKVLALAQLLQSLDADNNPNNGITINKEVKKELKDKLSTHKDISKDDVEEIIKKAGKTPKHLEKVKEHLEAVKDVLEEAKDTDKPKEFIHDMLGNSKTTIDDAVKKFISNATDTEKANIDLIQNLTIYYAQTGNMEFVSVLNKLYSKELSNYRLLYFIAKKYNIDTTAVSDKIKTEYETYLEEAKISEKDTLLTLAKVEVNTIEAIKSKKEALNAKDISILTDKILNDKYKTYWEIDAKLKISGETNGVCSIDELCHNEYPNNSHNKDDMDKNHDKDNHNKDDMNKDDHSKDDMDKNHDKDDHSKDGIDENHNKDGHGKDDMKDKNPDDHNKSDMGKDNGNKDDHSKDDMSDDKQNDHNTKDGLKDDNDTKNGQDNMNNDHKKDNNNTDTNGNNDEKNLDNNKNNQDDINKDKNGSNRYKDDKQDNRNK